MKLHWKNWLIIILVVLLILAIGYIVNSNYQQQKVQEQLGIYQQGMVQGYEQAVVQLYQQVATCQQVPIRVGNNSLNLVAVECLE